MFWRSNKDKKKESSAKNGNTALAEQDPNTKIRSISAATETTSTAVKSEFLFNKNTNIVTYQRTNETVTHQQRATVIEKITSRAPTKDELAEFGFGGNTTTTTSQIVARTQRPTNSMPAIVASSTRTQTQRATAQRTETRYASTRATTLASPAVSGTSGAVRAIEEVPKEKLQIAKYNGNANYQSPYRSNDNSFSFSPTIVSSSTLTQTQRAAAQRTETRYASTRATPLASPAVSGTTGAVRAIGEIPKEKEIKYQPPYRSYKNDTPPKIYGSDAKGLSPISVHPTVAQVNTTLKLKPAIVHIFNHEKFDNPDNQFRIGSSVDVRALQKVFKDFKCTVNVTTNATVAVVKKRVSEFASYDFKKHSALIIVVLSHGNRYGMIAAKDDHYSLDETILFPILRNKTLHEKPKLFFIQACKGNKEPGGYSKDAIATEGTPSQIFKCYSTFEGYMALRCEDGSPFIQELCKALTKWGHQLPINEIIDKVRTVVRQQTGDKQVPSVESTLDIKYKFGDYV